MALASVAGNGGNRPSLGPAVVEILKMGTVAKALELLDSFSRQRPLIGLSQFAQLSGLNKATCFRLLTALQAQGLVEQVGPDRAYRIGPAVLRLAALREAVAPRKAAVTEALRALAEATGETAHVSLIEGDRLGMLAFAYASNRGTRVMMEDADTLPLHATASGLAVLSFSAADLVDRWLAQPLRRFTPETGTEAATLRAEIAAIRLAGIAESRGGFEAEVHSLAIPLFDDNALCTGAVAVAAPISRMTAVLQHQIKAALFRSGLEIGQLWGGVVPKDIAETWREDRANERSAR